MCQLDSLRAAKQPLALPKPYDLMWQKITKVCILLLYIIIMTSLHIYMHACRLLMICTLKIMYEQTVTDNIPSSQGSRIEPSILNLMTAEQTFAWISRYKRTILCSMNKLHHQFFLHRIVYRRNRYTEWCIDTGRKVLLPVNVSK